MSYSTEDTIAAIATAAGEGGIGIVRLSGPQALQIADKLFQSTSGKSVTNQKTFTAAHGHVVDRRSEPAAHVDEAIVLVLKAPRSYTKEDMAEIQCHGGRIVVQKILDLCLFHGARLAQPGEFTKRAFLNGRLDLIQAEGVADLIRAKSEKSWEIANAHLEGTLSQKIRECRDGLTHAMSHIEASLDFPDDEIKPMTEKEILSHVESVEHHLTSLEASGKAGRLVHDGLKVVLTGKPNVGKSSLMNQLCGEERMIVSDTPGTTRDVVETRVEMGGYEIRFFDSAGIRPTGEKLESQSIERARRQVRDADFVLFVADASADVEPHELEEWKAVSSKPHVLVLNKSDIAGPAKIAHAAKVFNASNSAETSCKTAQGIDLVKEHVIRYLSDRQSEADDALWVHSSRQLDALARALSHVKKAKHSLTEGLSLEFAASDLRMAMDALGELVGEVVTDDILDRVFSQFCIGK